LRVRIDELEFWDLVLISFNLLDLKSQVLEDSISYLCDEVFLLSDIEISVAEKDDGVLLQKLEQVNLYKLIQKFLLEITITSSIQQGDYAFTVNCYGSKVSWTSTNLIKSCLMAVVDWYSESGLVDLDIKHKAQQEKCVVYIESMNLPILLLIKLKKMNVKTLDDLEKVKDTLKTDELKMLGCLS